MCVILKGSNKRKALYEKTGSVETS